MPASCQLIVKVTPRASSNKIVVATDGAVKVYVTAAPADGAANAAVTALLASVLKTAKSNLAIERGSTSRTKTVRVDGLTHGECLARLGEGG